MLRIITAGPFCTLQGHPRRGQKKFGIPESGPADAVSMALANRLVGSPAYATCIEITLGGFEAEAESALSIALTGAEGAATLNGVPCDYHRTLFLKKGDLLIVRPPKFGARTYLAIGGQIQADTAFQSTSTYVLGGFGGYGGRKLEPNDTLTVDRDIRLTTDAALTTPQHLRPFIGAATLLRTLQLDADVPLSASDALFGGDASIASNSDRTGVRLQNLTLSLEHDGLMRSAPVAAGIVQCPPDGAPIILGPDAQTTGGYPRIACVIRSDRHLIGQLAPNARVRFVTCAPEEAVAILKQKTDLIRTWVPDFSF
ncbi:MAG: biotin-dependent carboxyltransferase family protein [Pseudomonadota bacterium]